MTKQDNGMKAIDGQKTMEEQNTTRQKALECPACRFRIQSEDDHEPECANSEWSRDDVIEHIKNQSDAQHIEEQYESEQDRPWPHNL